MDDTGFLNEGPPDDHEGLPDDPEGLPDDHEGVPDDHEGVPDDDEGVPDDPGDAEHATEGEGDGDTPDGHAPGGPDRVRLRRAVRTDFASAGWVPRIALIGVVFWLAYEWGPGNETVTPLLLATVIGHTHGIAVIPLTALTGFVFTTAQQLASGFTALTGFSMFERTSQAAWRRLSRKFKLVPGGWDDLGWPTRCALVFGLGTTAVVLAQITATGTVGIRRHGGVVVRSATLCGTLVAAIGAFGATVALIGRRITALHGATEWILRVLGNPLFWFGLVVLGVLIRGLGRRLRSTP